MPRSLGALRIACLGLLGLPGVASRANTRISGFQLPDAPEWLRPAPVADANLNASSDAAFWAGRLATRDTWVLRAANSPVLAPFVMVQLVQRTRKKAGLRLVLREWVQTVLFVWASRREIRTVWLDRDREEEDKTGPKAILQQASGLFRLRLFLPRQLFSIGSSIRGLQLCTSLHRCFEPSLGVLAGVAVGANAMDAHWITHLLLGWACTPWYWKLLGASLP